jgi:hypothetical protein
VDQVQLQCSLQRQRPDGGGVDTWPFFLEPDRTGKKWVLKKVDPTGPQVTTELVQEERLEGGLKWQLPDGEGVIIYPCILDDPDWNERTWVLSAKEDGLTWFVVTPGYAAQALRWSQEETRRFCPKINHLKGDPQYVPQCGAAESLVFA